MKTFATSFACLGLLMVFTWAEGPMLLLSETMLTGGGVATLLRRGGARAMRGVGRARA